MKQRIISGVIIAAAVVGLGFLGSYPLYLILMFLSFIGFMELTNVMCTGVKGKRDTEFRKTESRRTGSADPGRTGYGRRKSDRMSAAVDSSKNASGILPDLIVFPGILLTVVYYAGLMYIEWRYGLVNSAGMISAADFWTVMVVFIDFLLTMGIYIFTYPGKKSFQATGAVTAFLYAPVLMSFICRTRNLRHGVVLYLLIFICSSVSDVCALAAGMMLGRHKLAPELSPKKTIEGAIGGVLGSAAASCIIALILRRIDPTSDMLLIFLIIGICGSIIGQTGDLAASAIKRDHNIKDYGNLIPGHGGIMDRFDSVLFTAPLIYYLSFLLMDRF